MKQNFKTLACIFAAATIAIFTASCKKEYFPEEALEHIVGVERHITTSASLPQSADKAYLDETDGRKVKWELTDALNINGTNLPLASLNADATTAKFEGTAYAMTSGSNDIYWAVYPTTIVGAASGSTIPSNFTPNSLTVNFPATQTYDASVNALSGNTLMAGYASVPKGEEQIVFQMRNLGAVLAINLGPLAGTVLSNPKVNKIEFLSENASLSGSFVVSTDQTNPTVTPVSDQSAKKVTLALSDGNNKYIDISRGAKVYVVLPPISRQNLKMRVYNTDGSYFEKSAATATLERNHIYENTLAIACFDQPRSFSVSANTQVVFAPGNLQYTNGVWSFVEHQWDYVGGTNSNIAQTYTGSIDLFGWGTSGYDNTANDVYATHFQPWESTKEQVNGSINRYGYGPSNTMPEYSLTGSSANYDWGVYNNINNPSTGRTDTKGTWRLLTQPESHYLFRTRTTQSGLRFAKAKVNNVNGMLILPDNWCTCTYALNSTDDNAADYSVNTISAADWNNILGPAGCVFLPAAGHREVKTVSDNSTVGYYWLSTYYDADCAFSIYFDDSRFYPGGDATLYNGRYEGRSVRLVKPYVEQ